MKNKSLIIALILVLVFVLTLLLLFFKTNIFDGIKSSSVKKNSEEAESLVNIAQSNMSGIVFITEESDNDYRVHINLQPYLNFTLLDVDSRVKSFALKNFKGESEAGDVLLISPTDLNKNLGGSSFIFTDFNTSIYTKDIKSNGNSISYEVVEEVTKFNQVNNRDYIMPSFAIIIKDIGSIDYEKILNETGVFDGGKYLEYLGVDLNKLDTTFQFDIEIVFDDNTKYVKRFNGELVGSSLAGNYTTSIELKVVE